MAAQCRSRWADEVLGESQLLISPNLADVRLRTCEIPNQRVSSSKLRLQSDTSHSPPPPLNPSPSSLPARLALSSVTISDSQVDREEERPIASQVTSGRVSPWTGGTTSTATEETATGEKEDGSLREVVMDSSRSGTSPSRLSRQNPSELSTAPSLSRSSPGIPPSRPSWRLHRCHH
jgi:hypothetical protein